MGISDEVRRKIEADIKNELSNNDYVTVDPDNPPILIQLSRADPGSGFVPVERVPDLSELPFITERMREFAFRYVAEYRTIKQWAKEFHTHANIVSKWLHHPGVRGYIARLRFEQQAYNFAQRQHLNRLAYRAFENVLNTKVNSENIAAIAACAKNVYEMLNRPEAMDPKERSYVAVNIGLGRDGPSPSYRHPQRIEKDVTPAKLEDLKAKIVELELLKGALDKGSNGNGSNGNASNPS